MFPSLESPPKFWDKISGWDFQRCKVRVSIANEKVKTEFAVAGTPEF